MTEDFLYYIWKYQKFDKKPIKTSQGEPIAIIRQGNLNTDSGPDFHDARLYIGEQLWAGNIEIHIKSSDWYKHRHQEGKAYQNVILHVVYEEDKAVINQEGKSIPTLELKGKIDISLYHKYQELVRGIGNIACENQWDKVDDFIKESMLERVLVERLEQKSNTIIKLWNANKKDWSETFYQWLTQAFGLKVNQEPMLMLAENLPSKLLAKHRSNLNQVEALLYGVSGLLDGEKDEYAQSLQKEFNFLKAKYQLVKLDKVIWKFARLRPPAFPTLRLAQLAYLFSSKDNLFSEILSKGDLGDLEKLLETNPSEYWQNHYRFGKVTERKIGGIGEAFKRTLVVNVIVPFLFAYGDVKGEGFYKQRAMDLLDQMEPESNKVTKLYENFGLKIPSSFHSQSVLQLHKSYCQPKKCLNCAIGTNLVAQ